MKISQTVQELESRHENFNDQTDTDADCVSANCFGSSREVKIVSWPSHVILLFFLITFASCLHACFTARVLHLACMLVLLHVSLHSVV